MSHHYSCICLLLCSVLLSLLHAEDDCDSGSYHPAVGDLLVGRSEQLTASSVCGLTGPQKYCIIGYLEAEEKCFLCDSRYPYNPYTHPNSHPTENVITTFEKDRKKKWWQSENGIDHISIRLVLETLFKFSHLILTFKVFYISACGNVRPAAMCSTDYGHIWKIFRYFAQNCAESFPNIPSGPAKGVGDIVCDPRYSDIELSTEGQVVLKALDPSFEIENPYIRSIQELTTLTNLRINFTKLHTLGDTLFGRRQSDLFEKYYYAVYEMVVHGSCFCNGHASQCSPVQKLRGDVFYQPGMVHGRCVCQHNTAAMSCERCKDFYNDASWRPAEGSQDNACKVCKCNGHSDRCHFNMAVYVANDHISGGICEDCQHHTMGQHCDQCKPFFYRDPLRAISDPYACIHKSCDCDPEGTLYSGLCESRTDPILGTIAGRCLCKENIEGVRCDMCRPSYYGLSGSDPLGCQPCTCNPSGSLSFSMCDPVTGECLCQRFVTGPHCDECLVGYWGLGNNLDGCSPCGCDIGGAHNNLCSSSGGQCECLPNIVGRRCTEPAPGYFFLPLDYYIYEAEHTKPLSRSAPLSERNSTLDIVFREPTPGKPVTWTGPGFARVLNGAGLRFTISNIPFAMDFDIALQDWIGSIAVNPSGALTSDRCRNKALLQEPHALALPATKRIALLHTPVCLDPGVEYFVDVYLSQPSASDPKTISYILIDSVSNPVTYFLLIIFIPLSRSLTEVYSKYFVNIGPHILPEVCARLIVSMSARIHNGAVPCKCHPEGSLSSSCSQLGGQCQCKPNVAGRCCDRCSAESFGFGFHGCYSCECHPQGSVSTLCDQLTGQCSCRREVDGRCCNQCLPGYFGFPTCRPCPCNGYAELCDPVTGACLSCSRFTTGSRCERCVDGYYGNPLTRDPCRPCMCPESPASSRYFADSCYQDPHTLQLVCNCLEGYSGNQCDECPSGFFGNPGRPGAQCLPCSCNNNIDVADPESCNKVTGECLKCLYNTHGPNCQFCKPGYFGSALLQNCRRCTCSFSGVNPAICPPGNGVCRCDQMTGICPCLPNVIGSTCDQCASGYWNMSHGIGCQFCDCNPRNSQSNQCNQFTGQCSCKLGYNGRRDEYEENYFGDPRIHSCTCNEEGIRKPECDKDTGACNCRIGVTRKLCDRCGRGFKQEFPTCSQCHLCFDQWDNEITTLSQTVQGLMSFAANLEDKRGTRPGCDMPFKGLEDKISEIDRIFKTPVLSLETFLKIKDFHVAQMDLHLNKMDEFPNLNGIIDDIKKEADQLYENLKQKIHLYHNLNNLSHKDSFSNIRKYYQMSLSAEQKISGAVPIIRYSENTRNGIFAMLGNRTAKENYTLEQLRMFKTPDIQKLNKKTCGWPVPETCRVMTRCGGTLCRNSNGNEQCGGPNCNGTLPLSTNTVKKAEETDMLLNNLTRQLQESENQVLYNLIHCILWNNLNQTEIDSENAKEFIRKVKDFLLDESAPPEDIEKVAKHVLDVNLPRTPQKLTNMLDKIRNLVTHCEDYEINVNKLNNQRKDAHNFWWKQNKLRHIITQNQVGLVGLLLQEFANLKRKYTILQEKVKIKGLPRETLEKLKQLKEAAEKLAEETEEKNQKNKRYLAKN
uniref:Laminin subunit beta 4 n=1 Tax=Gopherus evgoodei TaxID=1825980 RepID=A0A8C4VI90_9SAUR